MRARLILTALILCWAAVSFLPEPVLIYGDSWVKIFLCSILAASFFTRGKSARSYFCSCGDTFFWTYLALLSLGLINAQDKTAACAYYRHFFLSAVPLYFVFKNEVNHRNIRIILYAFFFCASIVALIGIFECALKTNFIYEHWVNNFFYRRYIGYGRLMSTLIHPNIAGAYLLSCIPCAWFIYRGQDKITFRTVAGVAFMSVIAAILLTYSRGTWISLVLVLTLWSILRGKLKYARWAWLGFALIVALASQPGLQIPSLSRYSAKTLKLYFLHGHRTLQYQVSLRMICAHPFTGIGLTNYRLLFNSFSWRRVRFEVMIPDSIYLMQLAEAGIFAFMGFMAFILHLGRKAIKAYRQLPAEKKGPLLATMMGCAGLLINMGSFDGFLWRTTLYIFWMLAGLTAALSETQDNTDNCQSIKT